MYLLLRGHGDDGEWIGSGRRKGTTGMVRDVVDSGNGETVGKVRERSSGGRWRM